MPKISKRVQNILSNVSKVLHFSTACHILVSPEPPPRLFFFFFQIKAGNENRTCDIFYTYYLKTNWKMYNLKKKRAKYENVTRIAVISFLLI